MHILFLSDNFPPEVNAPASRTFEHARVWVRDGHQVTVITCAPNFPTGQIFPGFRNQLSYERIDGIAVFRVPTLIFRNEGFLLRSLDYLSFIPGAVLAGLKVRRPDVVVATSPQFFCACGGCLLSTLRGLPFVFELRDLWPASITAVGAMRRGLVIRLLERLELFLYRRARAVVAVTASFKTELMRRGVSAGKVAVIRNGVDLMRYQPRPRDMVLATEWGLKGRFTVGYIGTHGMAHALGNVLEVAKWLRNRDDIHFLFVGDGAARPALMEQARREGLSNIAFKPMQTKDRMPAVWSCCDVALVHLSKAALFESVIPSKIFEAMGMGIPILYAGPSGEASRIVTEAGAGIQVAPEDPAALAEQVIALADDRKRCAALSLASRHAAPSWDRTRLARRMAIVLGAVISRPGRAMARGPAMPLSFAAEIVSTGGAAKHA